MEIKSERIPPSATTTKEKIDDVLTEYFESGKFNGVVLAAQGDDIVYTGAFGKANFEWDIPNTLDTRFKIASITKTFTACLVMHLIEIGYINLDDVITDYLPDYPSSTGDKITIEHLLVQSSGIPDYLTKPDFLSDMAVQHHDRYGFIKHFQDMELEFEPGTDWNYGNSGYYLLGLIIEKATGLTYEEAMRKHVIEPAGLENTGYASSGMVIPKLASGYIKTPDGYEIAPYFHSSVGFSAGMMYSNVTDLFKWTRALYAGKIIQNRNYLQNMITPQMEDYGYGLFIGAQKVGGQMEVVFGLFGTIHGFNSQVSYFYNHDFTIIIMDNTQQCTVDIFFAVRDILFGNIPEDNINPSIRSNTFIKP
ncbi:MAG: serine hydrolase domain-containing protein [Balneolales bacterium]